MKKRILRLFALTFTAILSFCLLCGLSACAAHAHAYKDNVIAPTCTEKGYTAHTCVCGKSYKDTFVDALGHSYTVSVTAPTDTEKGYTTHTCENCGDTYTDSYVDATGSESGGASGSGFGEESSSGESGTHTHVFGDWTQVKAPTCTEKGKEKKTCKSCDHYETREIDALGHDWGKGVVTEQPTEETDGLRVYTCVVCGDTKEENIPQLNHVHSYTDTVIAPTCTEKGYTSHTCACGDSYVDTYVDVAPHDEINHEAQEPTCTEIGWNAYVTCRNCDYTTYVETPATDHDYQDTITAPDCTEQGYTTHTCKNCGDCYVDTYVDATGHTYANGLCKNCGKEQLPSKGLKYALNRDKKGYAVIGIGTCTDTEVIIPSTYEDLPVTNIGDNAFRFCQSLINITIPDSVTSMGQDAFYNCKSLTNITIPDSVTTIESYTFAGCLALENVTIGNGVRYISNYAFSACTSLKNITIGKNVRGIGNYAFQNCTSLTNVYISSIEGWCNIEFYNTLYYRNPLQYAHNLYLNGELITDLVIPDGVPSISKYAFIRCTNITSITIPDSVKSIGENAFAGCTNLTSVTFGGNVTSIGNYAFAGCTNLTNITIPDSVTTIGNRTFYNTAYYNNADNWDNDVLYLGNHLIAAKTSISGAYTVKDGTKYIADSAFKSCSNLTSIMIPSGVTTIGKSAFYLCKNLTDVTIPSSVTSIGSSAFFRCQIESMTLPFIGGSATSNTYLEYIFSVDRYGDNNTKYIPSSLKSVTIRDGLTRIDSSAFYAFTGLTNITIPDSVTSIGSGAFSNTAYYNNADNWEDGVLYIGNYLIVAQTSISGAYRIKETTKCIADSAFYGCTGLTSITIPDSVTEIGKYAFHNCSNLTNITIPDSATSIGSSTFV